MHHGGVVKAPCTICNSNSTKCNIFVNGTRVIVSNNKRAVWQAKVFLQRALTIDEGIYRRCVLSAECVDNIEYGDRQIDHTDETGCYQR